METVQEADERTTSTPGTRPSRWRISGRGGCGLLSPLMRSWWMRLLSLIFAILTVVMVGVVVYRNSLSSKRQELKLKCENRVEVFKSEVDNNVGASFVILGLVSILPDVDQSTWMAFTEQTLFLRPHVRSLVYCLRVLPDQRAAMERQYNASFIRRNATGIYVVGADEEFTPTVLQSAGVDSYMVDLYAYPIFRSSLIDARDTGNFSLSAPYQQLSDWRMGSFLPYYGENDPATLETVGARRANCLGYVVTVLNVEEVFGTVISRFTDSDIDINAIAKVDPALELNDYYNCSPTANPCDVSFYGNSTKRKLEEVTVAFWYGNQNVEFRCLYKYNVRMKVLRSMVAWPLLMLVVVVFCVVAVYLVSKRMSTAELDKGERKKINAKLEEAKMEAEAADTAKTSFLATVSHEIRTPMNGVIGMTNLLMGTELSPQQMEYVKIAQASGNSLVALISDVLDLSKIEAGRMEIETVPFDMREEVDNILSLFEEKVHLKQLEISALVHDSVPQWLYGDPGRLRQVLINLVGNAIKFTKQGSIFLCVRLVDPSFSEAIPAPSSDRFVDLMESLQKHVGEGLERELEDHPCDGSMKGAMAVRSTLFRARHPQMAPPSLSMKANASSAACVAQWRRWHVPAGALDCEEEVTLVVSIEDTGIGIPKFMQTRLFEPFVQADSSTSREYGGTGIGLSICQKLVRLSGGDIIVESEPGEGSVFKFSLVLPTSGQRGDLQKLCQAMTRTPSGHVDERIRGIRVLLVDANPVRQEVAATYLRRVGALTEYAEGIDSALGLLTRADGPSFQAVIVDFQGLDPKSSLQLVQRLKQSPSPVNELPVLALSVPPGSAMQKEFNEAGYAHIVHKPLRCTTLLSGLLQILGLQVAHLARKPNANADLLAGRRLLVVDDNLVNRRVASSMLQRYGATVLVVEGGQEAIAAVERQAKEGQFDIILMDIQMPKMDGYEATKFIRRWEVDNCEQCRALEKIKFDFVDVKECLHHRIPIVAVTADVMKGTHETCFSAGMDDYIPKVWNEIALLGISSLVLTHSCGRLFLYTGGGAAPASGSETVAPAATKVSRTPTCQCTRFVSKIRFREDCGRVDLEDYQRGVEAGCSLNGETLSLF